MTHTIDNASIILRTDSYKPSHWKQLPPDTEYLMSYMEARGGEGSYVIWAGLNGLLKRYFSTPITMEDVDYAEERITKHLGPNIFNRAGWEYIVTKHNGLLPLRIRAVPEGSRIPKKNVLMTIENTDSKVPWLTNYVETILMQLWYPVTVATASYKIKQLIRGYLEKTGDVSGLDFKLHDFGYRGVSSQESAAIGGFAHLTSFKGSDTIIALEYAMQYYGEDMAAFSIPAAEHSTINAWGREFEYEAYKNMVDQFGDGALYAVVSDSYDIYNACEVIWGEQLKERVISKNGILVVRPDSGTPHVVVKKIANILGNKFGYTVNEKGYKVLNHVRIIQGDGLDQDAVEITKILDALLEDGWSADNIAFGMGGGLLQKCNRDTHQFAIKACSIIRGGKQYDIAKKPITDSGKNSFAGRPKLIMRNGNYETVTQNIFGQDLLETVWMNGKLLIDPTLEDIRTLINE